MGQAREQGGRRRGRDFSLRLPFSRDLLDAACLSAETQLRQLLALGTLTRSAADTLSTPKEQHGLGWVARMWLSWPGGDSNGRRGLVAGAAGVGATHISCRLRPKDWPRPAQSQEEQVRLLRPPPGEAMRDFASHSSVTVILTNSLSSLFLLILEETLSI